MTKAHSPEKMTVIYASSGKGIPLILDPLGLPISPKGDKNEHKKQSTRVSYGFKEIA